MSKTLVFFLLLCSAISALPQKSDISRIENAKQRIKEIAYNSNLLWILGGNGTLLTLDTKTQKIEDLLPDKNVADIYTSLSKQMYALVSDKNSKGQILKKTETGWEAVASLDFGSKETPFGISEYKNQLFVLTSEKIYFQQPQNKWEIIKLQKFERFFLQSPFAATDDGFIYFGLNKGEWGGGLHRIDIRTGAIKTLEKKDKELCGEPLDKDCDPVTAVIRDFENPNKVIASVGLVHFLPSGRILRVGEDDISVYAEKTYETKWGDKTVENEEAFFGLVRAEDSFWAVSHRGIYQFFKGGKEEFYKLPKLQKVAGVWLSEEIPNIIIVSTDINWAASVSGYTPLIAVKN